MSEQPKPTPPPVKEVNPEEASELNSTPDASPDVMPDHPDNQQTEMADDVEVDALVEGMDTDAPTLTEDLEPPIEGFGTEPLVETEKGDV